MLFLIVVFLLSFSAGISFSVKEEKIADLAILTCVERGRKLFLFFFVLLEQQFGLGSFIDLISLASTIFELEKSKNLGKFEQGGRKKGREDGQVEAIYANFHLAAARRLAVYRARRWIESAFLLESFFSRALYAPHA